MYITPAREALLTALLDAAQVRNIATLITLLSQLVGGGGCGGGGNQMLQRAWDGILSRHG